MIIHPLGCSVTEHLLNGINVLVSVILLMKRGITNTALLVFCDETTAFDCVSHEVLLCELELHRVTGIVLNWFRSYLHDRRQRVSLDCTATHCFQSDWESIKCGVRRGSILDPTLFNIYVLMISQKLWINCHTSFYMPMTLILY